MTTEIPGAAAPEQKKLLTTAEDARRLLTRTEKENAFAPTKESETATAKKQAQVGRLVMEMGMPPSDKRDRTLEKAWKQALKSDDSTPKELAEKAKQASFRLNDYMRQLRDETSNSPIARERKSFKREDVSKDTRQHDAEILRQIDEMFVNCQQDGLVTVHGNRLCNRVGYAAGRVRQLDEMLQRGDITEDQKKYILRVQDFFRTVMEGDPAWKQYYEKTHKPKDWSPAMENAAGAARFLAMLAAAALAVVATLLDLKNKKLSVYTMAWIGIAAGLGGAFVGKDKIAAGQLKFFTKSDWESLGLGGKNDRRAIEMVYSAFRRKGKTDRAFTEQYRRQREGTPSPNAKPIGTQEYINWLAGENPTDATDIAAKKKLESIAKEGKLDFFVQKVLSVNDPSARNVFLDLVENNTNSKTVSQELASQPKPQPAPAAAPQVPVPPVPPK
jgi:hypothetical protein